MISQPAKEPNNVNNGQLDLSDVLKVSPQIEKKYERTRLKGGEVLLTLVGSTGQSFVAPNDLAGWNVPRAIAVIRASEEVGADWINICLQSQETKHFLDVRANTTVQKTLNLKDVRDIPILIPPEGVKQVIEQTALSISYKIELNRQTNQTLEQVAQAIFKSWFVDFEPTRAKIAANENGQDPEQAALCAISGKSLDELEQLGSEQIEQLKTTAALFPDALVESELGEIPEGWELTKLSTWGDIVCGKTPSKKKKEYYGGGIPFIKIPDMHGNMYVVETIDSLTKEGAKTQLKKMLPINSVCVSCIATVGQVLITSCDSFTNQQINSIVPLEEIFTPYLYFSILDLYNHLHDLASGGSATLNLNTGNFAKIKIIKPSSDLLQSFAECAKPLMVKILMNYHQQKALIATRDTLLPKLLSGELSPSPTPQANPPKSDRLETPSTVTGAAE